MSATVLEVLQEMYKHIYMFFGFKNASDFIQKYTIIYGNMSITNTLQNNAALESFIHNLYKGKAVKNNAKHTHSLPRNVQKMDTSVCGCYVSLYDLIEADRQNLPITISFPVIIPFNYIFPFQAWDVFPNAIFDEIKLEYDLSSSSLVYCLVDPRASIAYDYKTQKPPLLGSIAAQEFLMRSSNEISKNLQFNRFFTQIGLMTKSINSFSINLSLPQASDMADQHIFNTQDTCWCQALINNTTLTRCDSHLAGFLMKPDALKAEKEKYIHEPYGFFAQRIERASFNSKPNDNYINITCNHALNKVTDQILLFPQHTEDITCFHNPHLSNLVLNTLGKNYPDKAIDNTLSGAFFKLMINASDLWYEEPSEEYEDSLTISSVKMNGTTPVRVDYPTDTTSFAITLRTERPSGAGIIDDGISSFGKNETITLQANPMFTGAQNVYYNIYPADAPDELKALHPIEPLLLLVNDMVFLFRRMPDGSTRCIYTDGDIKEELNKFML
jgi:hypothetical protein